MREADRQKSREHRDTMIRAAEMIVGQAHKAGGNAQLVTTEGQNGRPSLRGRVVVDPQRFNGSGPCKMGVFHLPMPDSWR